MDSGSGIVIFDVRGQLVKVLLNVIKKQPTALLAQLLDNAGTDSKVPLFVDANPERFAHILDWYNYGQMFLPQGASVDALLHDAVYFSLPNVVKVNGVERRLPKHCDIKEWGACETIEPDSQELKSELEAVVLDHWPEFSEVLDAKMRQIQENLFASACDSAECTGVYSDSLEFGTWLDFRLADEGSCGVCSPDRLRVLVRRLQVVGYRCAVQRRSNDNQDKASRLWITLSEPCQRPLEVQTLDPRSGRWCLFGK